MRGCSPLGFAEETGYLEEFRKGFDEYRRLDEEILPLAVSLALSLGRKRTLTAQCEDRLQALEQTLAAHRFTATR